MYRYLIRKWQLNLIAILLLIINSAIQVYAATKMTQVANSLIEHQNNLFLKGLSFVFLLWASTFFIGLLQAYVQQTSIQDMSLMIRMDIARGIAGLSYAEYKKNDANRYESWLQNDVNLIEQNALSSFYSTIRFLANAVFSLIALWFYHYSLFIVALLLMILITYAPKILKRYTRKGAQNISQANEEFLNIVDDGLKGYETLYAFDVRSELLQFISRGAMPLRRSKINYAYRQGVVGIIIGIINIGSQLVILMATGLLVLHGLISVGSILSTAELATKIFDSMGIVNTYLVLMDSTHPLFAHFPKPTTQLSEKSLASLNSEDRFRELKFSHVSFRYPNSESYILKDFSYSFTNGTRYVLTGKSGIGKSTLLQLAMGYLQPTSGQIYLNGMDLNSLSSHDINHFIRYLQQDTHIFDLPLDDNIKMGRQARPEAVQRIKESLSIGGLSKRMMSGGQRQMVALARLLLVPKGLVILDESFSSIDFATTKNLLNMLLSSEIDSLILVSHRASDTTGLNFVPVNLEKLSANQG